MAVLPACCAVDMDRLKGLIGRGEIELASAEDMRRWFPGCEVGRNPPFGALFNVPTFVEEALVNQRDIAMPSGDHRTAIRMRAADYVGLAKPRRGQFAVHEETFPAHPPLRGRRMGNKRSSPAGGPS